MLRVFLLSALILPASVLALVFKLFSLPGESVPVLCLSGLTM